MPAIRKLFSHYRYAAIALVTTLTLGIIGAVLLTTTSIGCSPANKLGLKTARCLNGGPVAKLSPESPSPFASPSMQSPPESTGASGTPPYNPGASNIPPYSPGASGNPNPPYGLPSSNGVPPLPYPVSNGAPPGVMVSCQLPVFAGGPGSGGFIVFPGQTFVADPRSAVTAPSPSPSTASPTPSPQFGPGGLQGWYGLTYDGHYSKWLPVPYRWVSPDGVHYAYGLGGDIYVQDVSNGTQLKLGQGRGFVVLDMANDGVNVVIPGQAGLWFLPLSGTEKQLSQTGFWQGVANGAAYGTVTSSVPQGAANAIEKLDLKSGTVWQFFHNDGQSNLMGFDLQGNPVIQTSYANPYGNAIFIAYSPTDAVAIAVSIYSYGQAYPLAPPIADSHGLWFAAGNAIILFAGGAWYWMAGIGGQLAGQCQ